MYKIDEILRLRYECGRSQREIARACGLSKAPVYDEMSRTIRNRFKAKNLTLRSGIRVRGRRQASRQE